MEGAPVVSVAVVLLTTKVTEAKSCLLRPQRGCPWTPWMWLRRQTVTALAGDEEEKEAGTVEDKTQSMAVEKKEDKEYEVWSAAVTKNT